MVQADQKPVPRFIGSIIFLVAYGLADGIAGFEVPGAIAIAPWVLTPAIILVAVHILGPVAIPVAVAAPFASAVIWHGQILGDGILVAVLQSLAFGGAALLVRRMRFRDGMERLRDVLVVFGVVTTAAASVFVFRELMVSAISGTPSAVAGKAGLFFSQMAAGVALSPVLLIAATHGLAPWRARPSLETLVQVVSLLLLAWEVFGQFVNEEIRFFYLLFLPLAWIAARHGVVGAAAGLAATYLGLMVSHLVVVHRPDAIIELQVRMLALAATSLALGAIVSERRATEEKLLARQTELAHVLRLNIGWEMASGLAHELNQPLTAAMSYGEAGLRLLAGARPNLEKAVIAFNKGLVQIEQAGDIIRRLRDFMKKGDIQVETLAIEEVIDDAMHLAGAEVTASGVVLHALVPPGLPPVLGDKTQIVQVILNLLRNAHQAIIGSAAGGGNIEILAVSGGDRVEVSVRDDGPGIAPEVLPRLFKPFVTTKAAGMGLGLSLSKSIIEAHDGRLWAESGPAGGAVFKFTLPVAETKGD